jgi:hypothetical protein
VAREGRQRSVEADSTKRGGERGPETLKTNLNRYRIIYRGEGDWEEVENGEEIHTGGEGDEVGETDDALALKELSGYHRVFGELPFPDNPGEDQSEADEKSAHYVCTSPWVSIAARLKGNEAVTCQFVIHRIVKKFLQESQASDGYSTADEVNSLENRTTGEAFRTGVRVWEIREEQSEANGAVVDA